MKDCYSVTTYSVQSILGLIDHGDIAIPEIQRPFVWDSSKVRDLVDSLYHGYPTGYLITWKNPDVKIKGGGTAEGKTVLIDGQQRVTALMAALVGLPVLNEDYESKRIKIAFNPLYEGEDTPFAVLTPLSKKILLGFLIFRNCLLLILILGLLLIVTSKQMKVVVLKK